MLASLIWILGIPALAALSGQLIAMLLRINDDDGAARLCLRAGALGVTAWPGGHLWWNAVVRFGEHALNHVTDLN